MLCLLLEGVTDRCLCRPYRECVFGVSARTYGSPSSVGSPKNTLEIRPLEASVNCQAATASPPHCFLYETAEGSARGRTRVESLGLGSNSEPV